MILAVAAAQQQQSELFENEDYGFRLQIPQGWVAQDISEEEGFDRYREAGASHVVTICREDEALPGIGGTYNCEAQQWQQTNYASMLYFNASVASSTLSFKSTDGDR